MTTVPDLFATIHSVAIGGDQQCFYCGAACAAGNPASEYVLDSFTGRSGVVAPGSPWVCGGCLLCLRESCAVDMIDGTVGRVVTKAAMRAFSWVVTERQALAASKAHLDRLRAVCLKPPEPPFAIVLSDSGKKHLLYRGVVCHDRDTVTVTLEEDHYTYQPGQLTERLRLCTQLIAATGKPALQEPPTVRLAISVCDHYGDNGLSLIHHWETVYADPLSTLATWLAPGRDEARTTYPAPAGAGRRGVPAKTRRVD